MKALSMVIFAFVLSTAAFHCRSGEQGTPLRSGDDSGKVYITDRTGKQWDVTHAVKNYGFDPYRFQYGLGPYAITPIINPKMIAPGEAGYPPENFTGLVLGVEIDGDARAYPIQTLSRHEVIDDRVGGQFVAVTY